MTRGVLATVLVAACLFAGCNSDDDPAASAGSQPADSVGPRIAGSVVQYADCGDWRRGTKAQREATVLELRDQLTAQSERDTASPLPDAEAYRIFQRTCAQSYASSLRLYKLYARAQGFAPLRD